MTRGPWWTAVGTAFVLVLAMGIGCSAPPGTDRALDHPTAVPTRQPVQTSPASPTAGPTQVATLVPSRTPVPTATPAAIPTVDRDAVSSAIAVGRDQIAAAGVQPLCLRWDDTDGDGEPEWLGVYARPEGPRRIGAFVIDNGNWHDLAPLQQGKYGLGEHAVCTIGLRDVNLDGRPEILIWGHAGDSIVLLHLFGWDGSAYVLIASFEGNAGVRLEERDGVLGEEVVVGHRAANDLVWEVVYTWDGATYGWTWDRHAWFYLGRPHASDTSSPERAVISFYQAVDERDLPGAYRLLTDAARSAQPYEAWAVGFATTVGVEASAVRETARDGSDSAVVSAQVLARDNAEGRIIATLWDVVWSTVRTADGWRLDSSAVVRLSQRELEYYR